MSFPARAIRALWGDRSLVLACVLAALLVAVAYNYSTRPRYEAVAEIEWMDKGGARNESPIAAADLSRAIDTYDLGAASELQGGPMLSPQTRIFRAIAGAPASDKVDGARTASVIALESRAALRSCARPNCNRVVVRAYDPAFAALAANGLARSLAEPSQRATAWLQSRLHESVREEAAAGGAADSAEAQAHLPAARETVARASEAASVLRTRAARLKALSIDELSRVPGVSPTEIATIDAAARQLDELQARKADLDQSLGPRHPDVIALQSRVLSQSQVLTDIADRMVHDAEAAAEAAAREEGRAREVLSALLSKIDPAARPRPVPPPDPGDATPGRGVAGGDVPEPGPAVRGRLAAAAAVPREPVAPKAWRNLSLAAAAGLLAGLALAAIRLSVGPSTDQLRQSLPT